MNSPAILAASALAGLLTGCNQATVPTPATLQHVTPAMTGASRSLAEQGNLIVYSAYQMGIPSPMETDPNVWRHSDYEVRDMRGQLVAKVRNQASASDESPAIVRLDPGKYRIIARTNGAGRVELPLEVVASHTTIIHLDGGAKPTGTSAPSEYDVVKIAGGRAVGWSVVTMGGNP